MTHYFDIETDLEGREKPDPMKFKRNLVFKIKFINEYSAIT